MRLDYPKVGIVVVTYNTYQKTKMCINSLYDDSYPNKIIVHVDSASDNVAVIEDFEKCFTEKRDITFIHLKNNMGYGHACNIGARQLKDCKYIVFLNNDVTVDKEWLFPLIEKMEKDSSIAVVQPKILNKINKNLFDYAGGAGGFMDYFCYPYCRGRIFFKIEEDNSQYDLNSDICWASGACMLVNRNVFNDVDGFDENYFMYVEENDLCWRIWNYGKRVHYVWNSLVYHEGCLTVSAYIKNKKTFYLHRNDLFMMFKNTDLKTLMYIFPIRICFDILSSIYYLFLYPKNLIFLLNSYLGFFRNLPKYIRIRRENPFKGSFRKNFPVFKGSIVIEYYLKGRKLYSELTNEK